MGWAPVSGVLVVAGRTLGALSPSPGGLICLLSQEGRWPGLRGGKSQDSRQPARREAWLRGPTPPPAVCPASVRAGRGGVPLGLFENGKKGGFYLAALPIPFALIFQVRKAVGQGLWGEVLQPLRSSTQGPVSFVGVQTPVVRDSHLGQQHRSPL